MSEFEDMIGKILGDPAEMEKITQLASQLMGGGEEKETEQGGKNAASPGPDMMKMMGKLFSNSSSGGDKAALVAALGPYLKPERRQKLEKALKISRLAGIAGIAISEMGEGNV